MASIYNNAKRLRLGLARTGVTDILRADLGAEIDDVQRVFVEGRTDRCYVTLEDRTAIDVRYQLVPPTYGLPVRIGKCYGSSDYEIIGTDDARREAQGTIAKVRGVAVHAAQHVFNVIFGKRPSLVDVTDPLFISTRQVNDLSLVTMSGMVVGVPAGYARVNAVDVYWPGGTLDDMTADIPAVANQGVVGRVTLSTTAAITVAFGSDFDLPASVATMIAAAPAEPTGEKTLGFVWLENGMTAVEWHHLLPVALTSGTADVGGGVGTSEAYLLFEDIKTSGTAGGGFTSGAWQTRAVTNEVVDTGGNGSLSGNQMTLVAGTYRFRASAPAYAVDDHQVRLQNISDTTTTAHGQNARSAAADGTMTSSEVVGRFTIAGTKIFELQHRCSNTRNTDGFGRAGTFGGNEKYARVEFWKEN